MGEKEARSEILRLVKQYYQDYRKSDLPYQDGERIAYASRIYDEKEMCTLVDSALDFWLTAGKYTKQFEQEFSHWIGVQYTSLVNSGSSANLLAFMALTSPELGEQRIMRGDEVITVAAGFPTTIAPILQYGAVPVFVDVTIPQYNIDVSCLEEARTEKTKAVMLAHTLGNPFDIEAVAAFCKKYHLWLIEDNCDSLGSKYTLHGKEKYAGTFGDIGTSSFYPPHHMTMGEGGAVYTDNPLLHKLVRSFRDWGRDCSCEPGQDNLCRHRYDGQYGQLPKGYDHKYVYSHFGYNLKATDLQAAIGCEQLQKLDGFGEARRKNWTYLYQALEELQEAILLPQPCNNSDPSWFGFLITCKEGISRNRVVQYLEAQGVQTRMLFAGNIIKHPCFDPVRDKDDEYRVIGSLKNTDTIMNQSFWIGVYPGMTEEMLQYMARMIKQAIRLEIEQA